MSADTTRRILLLLHPTRPEAREVAVTVANRLSRSGLHVVVLAGDHASAPLVSAGDAHPADPDTPVHGCELVLVLGGDGTILHAAEIARGTSVPVLGMNLGHVGFLAEVEREEIGVTVEHIVERNYVIEERMALDVVARQGDRVVFRSWALNEVSVEKAARARMIELTVEIDGRPLSTWGCDGLVVATPTGSTAYAFSAGGPIIWPDVEAILLTPISAHALFARSVVVGPRSRLAVELLPHNDGFGVVWCDGRRAIDLPPGARIQVERSPEPVRLAQLAPLPFADRLVRKFDLPVHGWRGGARAADAARERRDGA